MPNIPENLEQYESFAELFEELEQYELAAYFYQVSKGKVEARVYDKVFHGRTTNFLGIIIERKKTVQEQAQEEASLALRGGINIIGKGIGGIVKLSGFIIFSPFLLVRPLLKKRQNSPRALQRQVNSGPRQNEKQSIIIVILIAIVAIIGIAYYSLPDSRKIVNTWVVSKVSKIFSAVSNFKPWTPKNIKQRTLEASTEKFETTINSFKGAETQINSNEGYKIKPKIIYSVMLNNICLVIVENSDENKTNNCLDISLFDKDIKNLPKDEKQKWGTAIYQYEYENKKAGFKVDGVIDPNEQAILQEETVKTLDNDFNNITRQAIEDLILEIKSEKPDLQYIYIQTSLRKILKANSYAKPIEQQWENDTDQDKRKLKGEWIQGIYDFQVKHELKPPTITYGVIKEQNDLTYQKLKEIAIQKLTIPETVITKGMNQFGTTKSGFENVKDQVYNNLVADQGLREKLTARYELNAEEINNNNQKFRIINDIEEEIGLLLGKKLLFTFIDDFQNPLDQEYKKEWIEAIYLYQKYTLNFNTPDGVMSPNGQTDKPLIEEITNRMKEKLQQ